MKRKMNVYFNFVQELHDVDDSLIAVYDHNGKKVMLIDSPHGSNDCSIESEVDIKEIIYVNKNR